jgi:DNA gyrase/topoisomerase IV subunit A
LLSQQAKKAATERGSLSELPLADEVNSLIDESNRVVAAIHRAIPATEVNEEVNLAEQSAEEAQEKIGRLTDLIRDNNPEAVSYASQLIAAYKFSEVQHKAILDASQQLEQFEFDEALNRLNAIQHAS